MRNQAIPVGATSLSPRALNPAVEPFRGGLTGARHQFLVGSRQHFAHIAKAIGDGIAAVAPENLLRDLYAPRRLTPPVLPDVEQPVDPRHRLPIKNLRDDPSQRPFTLHP